VCLGIIAKWCNNAKTVTLATLLKIVFTLKTFSFSIKNTEANLSVGLFAGRIIHEL